MLDNHGIKIISKCEAILSFLLSVGGLKIFCDELIPDILMLQIKKKVLRGDCLFELSKGAI